VMGGGVGTEAKASHVLAARNISRQGWNSEVEKK
jgi:hypothetical protein